MADENKKPVQSANSANPIIGVVDKIRASESILVALSKDPSVDELAAAIALTMMLDNIGKHATAIFSGQIPRSIDFLQPGKTLEANTNSLQDFIISLNKEKADHLRYKVEGDFVKIYITPYRTELSERDLEFSRGEYNVNLVISINVQSSDDLDSALAEHGRIMHDATSVNVGVNAPGKFGDLEWSDQTASSVCEMVNTLTEALKDGEASLVDPTIATILLTGIMAATDRFGNERTTPGTLTTASQLMSVGADQRLISENIKTEPATGAAPATEAPKAEEKKANPTKLSVRHDEPETEVNAEPAAEESAEQSADPDSANSEDVPGEKELERVIQPPAAPTGSALLDELRVATSPQTVTADKDYSSMIEQELAEPLPTEVTPVAEVPTSPEEATAAPDTGAEEGYIVSGPKTVIAPPAEASAGLDSAIPEPAPVATPEPVPAPELPAPPSALPMPEGSPLPPPPPPFDPTDAAAPVAPPPELPQVVVPPIAPAAPPVPETPMPLGEQPAMQDQVYAPQVNDPGAFRLPGQG